MEYHITKNTGSNILVNFTIQYLITITFTYSELGVREPEEDNICDFH